MPNRQGGMMAGQGTRLAAIYGNPVGKTESCEVLADSRINNVTMGSTSSIPVVREQYCLCTPTTRLEKILVIVVVILALIIVLLIIAISVLGDRERGRNVKEVVQALTPKI